MNTFDIILALLLAYGLIKGLFKGFFVEVASLLGLILGVYGALLFSDLVAALLEPYVDLEENYLAMIAFVITFIGIVVLIALSGKLLTKLASLVMLGWLNRLLGGVFGLLKVALIAGVLLVAFEGLNQKWEWVEEDHLEESLLYSPVQNLGLIFYPYIEEIGEFKH
jgi:membrane protein required for colicin V production